MCRADVDPAARVPLAALLDEMATVLAEQAGVPRESVVVGPVDFGTPAVPKSGDER